MGRQDGTVKEITTILGDHDDRSNRLNIVLLAEGYTSAEQNQFNDNCQDFVDALEAENWFNTLGKAINVYRLNVESTQSGADIYSTCPPNPNDPNALRVDTYFDVSNCHLDVSRWLSGDESLIRETLDMKLPEWDIGIVIVNTTVYGGFAMYSGRRNDPAISFVSTAANWVETALHEMGHNLDLADEYDWWDGCGTTETNCENLQISCDNAPLDSNGDKIEPLQFNVTTETNLKNLKWKHLLTPGVPVPIVRRSVCANCGDQDLPPDTVSDHYAIGLYEGAKYFHCGRYRPAYRCRMRNESEPFCRVCVEAIAKKMAGWTTTPVTTMEVEPTGLESLDFGEVASGLTQYLSFKVANVREDEKLPGAIDVTVKLSQSAPEPTDEEGFALSTYEGLPDEELTEEGLVFASNPEANFTFTLPAPILETEAQTERQVYVAFKAPTIEGDPQNFTGEVEVSFKRQRPDAQPDDPPEDTKSLTLSATAVSPQPVDSVLVIDRSGSMSEATGVPETDKMDLAIDAAELYVSLLRPNDRIGIVRYNIVSRDPEDILLDMEEAGEEVSGQGRIDAYAALTRDNLEPDGRTSIGAGIINGSSVLENGTADARALVVLTDGRQNTDPNIEQGRDVVMLKEKPQRVFAVGLDLNQLQDKLDQIASVTNGTAQITGDLVQEREFWLQKLYVQILSDVEDEAFIQDPVQVAHPGERQSTTIPLSEADVAADFIVVFRRAKTKVFPEYGIELEAPDGKIFTPSDMAALPNAKFVQQPGHCYFRWQFPTFPNEPHEHKGTWKVWIENRAEGEYLPEEILTYSVMAKACSDLRLSGRVVQSDYRPGSPMEIVLEPTLFGLPVELDTPVQVRITRPDAAMRTVILNRDEQGVYRATFTDTESIGPYIIQSDVSVTTPAGYRVTRFRQMTGLIFWPSKADGLGGLLDWLFSEVWRLLNILREFIERLLRI